MSRGVSPNSATYELSNSLSSYKNSTCDQDTLSNLKIQVFAKDQDKKDFKNLLSLFNNLQAEIAKISEQKKRLEIALAQLESDERNSIIIDLKNKNENLFNELNEKIALNKKLYNENNKLFQELEAKTTEGEDLQDQIVEQEEIIKRISSDKETIKNKVIYLSQIKEKQSNDIHDLNVQINALNFQHKDQGNTLKNKNGQNYDIIGILKEEQNIFKNLTIELKAKENDLITSQQELNKNNDNIHLLQCNVNNLANVIKKTKEDITIVNNNYINETSKLNQLNANNQKSNLVIKDRDEHIKQINIDNELIKQNNTEVNCENNKLLSVLDAYKKHLCLLVTQNKKAANEIKYLLGRDRELKEILERDKHLKDVKFENQQFVSNSNTKIRDFISSNGNGKILLMEKNISNNTTTTIKRTYSIDSKNWNNRNNNMNNIERINSMDDRDITNNLVMNKFQENKLIYSQDRYMDDNEKEEI